jgi:hypothetical protein
LNFGIPIIAAHAISLAQIALVLVVVIACAWVAGVAVVAVRESWQ